jgi:hypothetical protein
MKIHRVKFTMMISLLVALLDMFAMSRAVHGAQAPHKTSRFETTSSRLTIVEPASGAEVTDVDFFSSDTFHIEISHDAGIATKDIKVKLIVDNGKEVDITRYFKNTKGAGMRSGNLQQVLRTLFDLPGNTRKHRITIQATISKNSRKTTPVNIAFSVTPFLPPSPPSSAPVAYVSAQK